MPSASQIEEDRRLTFRIKARLGLMTNLAYALVGGVLVAPLIKSDPLPPQAPFALVLGAWFIGLAIYLAPYGERK